MRAFVPVVLVLAACAAKNPNTATLQGPQPGHPDLVCPSSTEPNGMAPPHGLETYCQRTDIRGDVEKHGPYLRWHTAATLAIEGNYYADAKHGAWTEYYPTGRPKLQGHYDRGEPDGPWVEFAESGQKTSEGTMEDGHPEGSWVYWNDLGQRLRDGSYTDGEMDGEWRYYRPDGEVRLVRTYRLGRLIQQVEQ